MKVTRGIQTPNRKEISAGRGSIWWYLIQPLRRKRQADLEFEPSMIYIMSSKAARAAKKSCVSKQNKQKEKKLKEWRKKGGKKKKAREKGRERESEPMANNNLKPNAWNKGKLLKASREVSILLYSVARNKFHVINTEEKMVYAF